jgi:hypothetical protein
LEAGIKGKLSHFTRVFSEPHLETRSNAEHGNVPNGNLMFCGED